MVRENGRWPHGDLNPVTALKGWAGGTPVVKKSAQGMLIICAFMLWRFSLVPVVAHLRAAQMRPNVRRK